MDLNAIQNLIFLDTTDTFSLLLRCTSCNTDITEVEHGDYLEVLVSKGFDHTKVCKG